MDRDSPRSPSGPAVLAAKPNELSRKPSMRSSLKKPATTPLKHEGRECVRESAKENARAGSVVSASSTSPDPQNPDSTDKIRPSFATHTFASHRRTQSTLSESKHPRLHRSTSSTTSLRGATPETPRDSPRFVRAKTTTPGTNASTRSQHASQRDRSPSMRQPIGLKEAFNLARQQEPGISPIDDTIDLIEAFQRANAEYNGGRFQGSPSPAPRGLRLKDGTPITGTVEAFLASNKDGRDLTKQLQQFDRNQLINRRASASLVNGLSKNRIDSIASQGDGAQSGAAAREYDPESRENMSSTTPTANRNRRSGNWSNPGRDDPLPSIEDDSEFDEDKPTPAPQPSGWSPEKGLHWNLEAEFTAGDLQISDSPRIIHVRGRPRYAAGTPEFRRSNDLIDRIRNREAEVDGMSFSERPTTKLDDIRARERQNLSPRAIANSKLDEIRARNSEARSASPEMVRRSMDDFEDPTWPLKPNRGLGLEPTENAEGKQDKPSADAKETASMDATTVDSTLGLDQIKQEEDADGKEAFEKPRPAVSLENLKTQIREGKAFKDRPTPTFAGIRRVQSSDSIRDKRSSAVHSESDPTDRIEAEMKLFAPLDKDSERGSLRTASRSPSERGEEDTPRPPRIDPLTMPTPRVTGAYVDTPATQRPKGLFSNINGIAGKARPFDVKVSASPHRRSVSMPSLRRKRSRSRSRPRPPPINSAKKVSVKDDLRAIMKEQQIEDSTLDDFDGVLEKTECDEDELEQEVNSTLLKVEDKSVSWDSSDRDRELEQLERVLHGIRDSKHGIARLEDKVSHSDKGSSHTPGRGIKAESLPPKEFSAVPVYPVASDSVVVSLPRLFHQGTWKPTKLGFWTLLFGLWLFLEGMFTQAFSGPQYACTPETPCEWSPNEPYFPYTMPFMLDEWTTGGMGRSLVWQLGEELGDAIADISDWVTNTDFSQRDPRYMGVWERKRHRRRLRKHGLIPKWVEPPEYKGKYAAWHAAHRHSQRSAASSGGGSEEYEYQADDEKMDADEPI